MTMANEVKKEEIQETVTNKQPSINTIPFLFQKWNDIVLKEVKNAEECAMVTFDNHMRSIEKFGIYNGFRLGYKLALRVSSERTQVFRLITENGKTSPRLFCDVPHPIDEIKAYTPEARRAYYRQYMLLIQKEFGNVVPGELFELHPESYLQEVLPWLEKYNTSRKNSNEASDASTQHDDIELLFLNRRK